MKKTFHAKALFVKNAAELFTGFLKLFQKTEPLVHVLYNELVLILKKILARLLRLEAFQGLSGVKLAGLVVECSQNRKPNMELGADTEAAIMSWTPTEKTAFRIGARLFYITCSKYLITRLPLTNMTLQHLRCLHPDVHAAGSTRESFRYLAKCATQVIQPSQVSCLLDEATILSLEPPAACSEMALDKYWHCVFEIKYGENKTKNPLVSKLVKALLSLLHGNADVEHGFSRNNKVLP